METLAGRGHIGGSAGGGGCAGTMACVASSGHEWICTLGGAVIAAGVAAAILPSGPRVAVTSMNGNDIEEL